MIIRKKKKTEFTEREIPRVERSKKKKIGAAIDGMLELIFFRRSLTDSLSLRAGLVLGFYSSQAFALIG